MEALREGKLLTRRLHERVAEGDNFVVLVEGDVGHRIGHWDAVLGRQRVMSTLC